MKSFLKDATLTIVLPKRVDTASAGEVGRELTETCEKNPHDRILLDASELTFISSSGLRLIVSLAKKELLTIINVNQSVFNVFEMTGLNRMIHIEKALRKVELKDGNLLGKGANGAVYRISDDEIVKMSFTSTSREELQKEIDASREAFICGVPTAISYDVVDCCDGHLGTVFEAIDNDTLSGYVMTHPEEFDTLVDKYVALLKSIHTNTSQPGNLPRLKDRLKKRLETHRHSPLPDHDIDTLQNLLDLIPDGNSLVHCDCHPKNVMIQNGELLFIDIADISVGNPMFDFMMFYLLETPQAFGGTEEHARVFTGFDFDTRNRFKSEVFRRYFNYNDEQLDWLNAIMDKYLLTIARLSMSSWPISATDNEAWPERVRNITDSLQGDGMQRLLDDLNKWSASFF